MTFRPIVFGEVLFDIFDNGEAVLGGAPFNVAWHLQGFGMSPVFISRVGRDSYGEQIKTAMQEWGMTLAGLQTDEHHPTGRVNVSVQEGKPQFDIQADVAYDHIDEAAAVAGLADPASVLLYHGSLVARTGHSLRLVHYLREHVNNVFVDINLRAPWWDRKSVEQLINRATVLKVNDEELATLMDTGIEKTELEKAARAMQEKFQLDGVIVTRGEQGAFLVGKNQLQHCEPVRVEDIVDTVGAGDGFSAICLLGRLSDWDEQVTLQRATEFAAQICRQRGAISRDPALYKRLVATWST